jgi:hypothetical protein
MNRRPPKLPRRRNIAITLAMLAAMIGSIICAIQAESRIVSAALFLLALFGLLPRILARAVEDWATTHANQHLDALCDEKEAAAMKPRPPDHVG